MTEVELAFFDKKTATKIMVDENLKTQRSYFLVDKRAPSVRPNRFSEKC